ncbi:host attachment family protein [Bradyrhizobium aeschynomenes]|uniref:host attachment family protein n=1 Tax=Bradyrhizobium aeschynomenes TaxID=2734909 RepID=UPI0015553E7D|nr:host attachment family protein [Bradyrhizobium aeschynomenes]NPV19367.1 host attachment protein [Bradyrhizobium aeschynomenes]
MKKIPQNALVIVADGRKAIAFRLEGTGDAISLKEQQRLSPKHLSDDGPSGSRPEEQTLRQTDEATFAKQLAKAIEGMKHAHEFDSLVLVADPQTLGQLRNVMHKDVRDSIVLTIAKDLTNHPAHEIADVIGRST